MKKYVLFMLLLTMSVPAAYAQTEDVPLITTIYQDNAIYRVEDTAYVSICETGEPRAMKSAASSSNVFRVSPDGRHLVFHTWANGEPDPNEFPNPSEPFYTNTWLCDLTTGEAERLPHDTDVFQSLPVFSPDGEQLAWSQTTSEDSEVSIVSYVLASGETPILANFEADMMRQQVPFLDWGEPGIAVSGLVNRGERSEQQLVILLNPPEEAGDGVFAYDEPLNSTLRAEWVEYDGEPRLMLRGFDVEADGISLITPDFETLEMLPASATVEYAHRNGGQLIVNSRDVFAGTLESNPDNPVVQFTFSPNGEQVAYVRAENYPNGGNLYVGSAFVSAMTGEFDLVGDEADADTPGVQAIAWGAPRPVVVGASATVNDRTVELTSFYSPDGWVAPAPTGWQQRRGTFTRDDDTLLVFRVGDALSIGELVAGFERSKVEPYGEIEDTLSGNWTVYQYDYREEETEKDLRVYMGVARDGGTVYTIFLKSSETESQVLYDEVLLPAIYNFQPVETFEAQPPIGGVMSGEETILTGTVTGTIDDCAFDGNCALVLQTEQGEINAVWAEGMVRCEGSYTGDAAIGDFLEIYGVVRDAKTVSICPSADYYIRQAPTQ